MVFDLNGTLLDLSALDPLFAELTGQASNRKSWFDEIVKLMLISAATSVYHPFDDISDAALSMIESTSRVISSADRKRVQEQLQSLPAFPDVVPALDRLTASGQKLVAFTNGSLSSAHEQLKNAKISKYFSAVHSADEPQRYKPSLEAYEFLAQRLEAGVSELMLVAAHDWDISGASWSGLQTAFVARPGQTLSKVSPRPNIHVDDFNELAASLTSPKAA